MPSVTEKVQWGNNLVFYVGGKIFAIADLEVAPHHCLSFKSTPENAAELTSRLGFIPAPYLARAHWVALESYDAVPRAELCELLRTSYNLVYAKLPAKTRRALETEPRDSL